MDYSVEYRKNKMPMELFQQRYQDKEKYMAYCRECPRYDTVWSCPPLDIDAEAYQKSSDAGTNCRTTSPWFMG